MRKYQKSKDGLASMIYSHQKYTSKCRGYLPPLYSKKEFKEWLFSQHNFKTIYKEWVKSGYEKDLYPSPDRTDDYKPYSLDRLVLTTFKKNREKSYTDRKEGINNKSNKAIIKFTKNMVFICEYHSLNEAARKTGILLQSIHSSVSGKTKTSGGYIWKYKIVSKNKMPQENTINEIYQDDKLI